MPAPPKNTRAPHRVRELSLRAFKWLVAPPRHPWLVFFLALALYGATVYPGVGGRLNEGDSAKFQYVGAILGIPHPPGSPLYVLATHLWSYLAWPGDLALRINLFSTVCGAAAVGFAFALLRRLGFSGIATAIGTVALATAEATWMFATEAELYAPALLVVTFVVHRLVLWQQHRHNRDLWLACFAYALGFGNHYVMITLLPGLALWVLWTDWRAALSPRNLAVMLGAVVVGLLPFLWLWSRIPEAPYSEIPVPRTWGGFVDFLLARQYRGQMFGFPLRDLLSTRLGWGVSLVGKQVGYLGLLLLPLGVLGLSRRAPKVTAGLVVAGLVTFLFVIGYRISDSQGILLPALLVASVFLAAAVDFLRAQIAHRGWRVLAVWLIGLQLLPGVLIFAADLGRRSDQARAAEGKSPTFAFRRLLPCLLRQAEPGAILVSPADDYGTRQIVNFHRFTKARPRRVRIEYRRDPPGDWHWARPAWSPNPASAAPVYVFEAQAQNGLRSLGFRIEPRSLARGACGAGSPPLTYFRALSPAAGGARR